MAKIRSIRKHEAAVPVDHPDGGTLHIYPFDAQRNAAVQDGFNQLRYETGEGGALVLKDGKPVERELTTEQVTKGRINVIREHLVAKLTNVVDVDDPFELDDAGQPKIDANGDKIFKLLTVAEPAALNDFLGETSNHQVEREVAVIEWLEREVKKETVIPSADGGESSRIIETRMELFSEPVIENGKAKMEKRMVPANQPMHDWVFDRARELVSSSEAEVKNSSPTPAGSSA